jgi:hypothetical protein
LPIWSYLNFYGPFQHFSGQRFHLFGECGGEEDGLAVRSDVVHNLHHLWLEAHVKHAVRFVQHQVGDPAEVGDFAWY